MLFDDPQRRRVEIKLLAQTIQQISLVREMQSRFATRRENHERRRTHTHLRQILNLQPRHAALRRRWRGPASRLRNRTFEEVVELRRRNTSIPCFIRLQNKRQYLLDTLTSQR